MPSNDPRKSKKKVTTAKGWKKSTAEMDLELPSGNVCKVKRPGLTQLLSANVLPDILSPIADKAMKAAKGGVTPKDEDLNKDLMDGLSDEGGLPALMSSFGRVVAYCVVEPKVQYHQEELEKGSGKWTDIPEDERDEDVLYTDVVDLDDQMFIFNFVVGGTADLTEFRKQLGESVVRVESGEVSQEDAS